MCVKVILYELDWLYKFIADDNFICSLFKQKPPFKKIIIVMYPKLTKLKFVMYSKLEMFKFVMYSKLAKVKICDVWKLIRV